MDNFVNNLNRNSVLNWSFLTNLVVTQKKTKMVSKFRINYGLYAKYREIKHLEKTQIFEDSVDRMGVRINWEHFGKVLEAKQRMIKGEDAILYSPNKKRYNSEKFSFKHLFSGLIESFSLDGV